jgi:hypothetical protein
MSPQVDNPALLSDKSIWIIDDDIPLQFAEFNNDSMLDGSCPIDRGTLLSLMLKEDNWDDKAVLELCRELVDNSLEIKAFLLPTSAVDYLRKGARAPDVMIFDMNYRTISEKQKVLDHLENILNMCISVIQVYTREALEEIKPDLVPLQEKYARRLEQPRLKSDTNADQLEQSISHNLSISLSAQLATNIRRLSTIAIENVLVNIDKLPLHVAIKLLIGDNEGKLNDIELVELLSSKFGDYLISSRDFTKAISEYAQKSGIPTNKEKVFVDAVADVFATMVRNSIQYDKWIYEAIRLAKKQVAEDAGETDETIDVVRNFFAYRVYDHPGDDFVRTGDIISFPARKGIKDLENPDLFLVLTPACDLAHFWWKTRGVLSLVKMYPISQTRGIERVKAYEHQIDAHKKQHSITSDNPFLLPSVKLEEQKYMDYLLFVHEIIYEELNGERLTSEIPEASDKRNIYKQQLTYSEVNRTGKKIKRLCRVSEPFLKGILSEIRNALFRDGVPDFPDEEQTRLLCCLRQ